jgi:hypothetical protein
MDNIQKKKDALAHRDGALPHPLEQTDSSRSRHIEGFDMTWHGDANLRVGHCQ